MKKTDIQIISIDSCGNVNNNPWSYINDIRITPELQKSQNELLMKANILNGNFTGDFPFLKRFFKPVFIFLCKY